MAKNEVRNATALAIVNEALSEMPGGSTALAVVQAVFRKRAAQRATELFTAIGVATGAADADEAAAKLAENVEKPWFQEAIEAGFRELMNATDPAVRACLAVLVAEYVVERKPPDLKFRRAGAVLRETAGTALPTMLALAAAYVEAIEGASEGLRVLIRPTRQPGDVEAFCFAAWVAPHDGEKGSMHFSPIAPTSTDFEDCKRALVGAGVGSLWTGLSSAQFQGDPIVAFDSADDGVMSLLHLCLRTAGARPRDGEAGQGVT